MTGRAGASLLEPPAPKHVIGRPAPTAGGRGSWWPTWPLLATKFRELRKRRWLMVAVLLLTVGLPVIVLGVRLLAHAIDPHSYGPAGSPSVFQGLMAPMPEFGFIVAAALGASAGTTDLTDGVFRHLVITGRSRVALYLARIPSGLSIILPLVGVAFSLLCVVTVYAGVPQPTTLNENGIQVPLHLDQPQLETWLLDHPRQTASAFPLGPKAVSIGPGGRIQIRQGPPPSTAEVRQFVEHAMGGIFQGYTTDELSTLNPATNEMVKIGLWLELEVLIGFMVGLGLGSLVGQRMVATILMIALELIVGPILANVTIPHFINGQRLIFGVAMAQLRPAGLAGQNGRRIFGGHAALGIPSMPTWAMISVIVGWLVGWSIIGAWRMATRDA